MMERAERRDASTGERVSARATRTDERLIQELRRESEDDIDGQDPQTWPVGLGPPR